MKNHTLEKIRFKTNEHEDAQSMRPDEMHLWDLREFSEEFLSHYL